MLYASRGVVSDPAMLASVVVDAFKQTPIAPAGDFADLPIRLVQGTLALAQLQKMLHIDGRGFMPVLGFDWRLAVPLFDNSRYGRRGRRARIGLIVLAFDRKLPRQLLQPGSPNFFIAAIGGGIQAVPAFAALMFQPVAKQSGA